MDFEDWRENALAPCLGLRITAAVIVLAGLHLSTARFERSGAILFPVFQ